MDDQSTLVYAWVMSASSQSGVKIDKLSVFHVMVGRHKAYEASWMNSRNGKRQGLTVLHELASKYSLDEIMEQVTRIAEYMKSDNGADDYLKDENG